jgi:hypothetical protein
MIEKKISYPEVKPEKPLDIKPVMQGGKLNYLGKQKMIKAPIRWKSGPTHPETHLAYISKEEEDILVKLNIYKSMDGKPNKGPYGLPSLDDGDGSGGGGSGSDGAGAGDSGGSGGGASASGGGGDDGASASDAGDAGTGTGDSAGAAGSGGTDGPSGGQGPGGEEGTAGADGTGTNAGATDTFGSSTAEDTAANEAASQAAQSVETSPTGLTGIMSTISNAVSRAFQNAINNPLSTVLGMVNPALGFIAQALSNPQPATPQSLETAQVAASGVNSAGGVTSSLYTQAVDKLNSGQPLNEMDRYILTYRQNLGLPPIA